MLLTGARTAIALEVARALHRDGHRVFTAESFPRYVAQYSNCVEEALAVPPPRLEPDAFIDALAAWIASRGITRLIPTGEEALWVARGRARLEGLCEVFCDRLEVLDALHDKQRFQELAAAIGPVPQTWRPRNDAHLAALRARHGPLILKEVYSRFGQGIRVVADQPSNRPPGRWIAQEWIEGRELCGLVIARKGVLAGRIVYLPRHRMKLGPAFYFEPVAHEGADDWMRRFVARYALSGCFGFDFMERDGTLYPLECNPRMTSGVHLLAANALSAALLGRAATDAVSRPPAMWAVAMLGVALPRARSFAALRAWSRDFRRARDVFRDRNDPRPARHLFSSQRHLRAIARQQGVSIREAATFYTRWDG